MRTRKEEERKMVKVTRRTRRRWKAKRMHVRGGREKGIPRKETQENK